MGAVIPNPKIGDIVYILTSSIANLPVVSKQLLDQRYWIGPLVVSKIDSYGEARANQLCLHPHAFTEHPHLENGSHYRWTTEQYWGPVKPVKPSGQRCKNQGCPEPEHPYAEPNQTDGSFICYSCRSVWRPGVKPNPLADAPDIEKYMIGLNRNP